MPVPPFEPSGFLPAGRHSATPAEMKASLVLPFVSSVRRSRIFDNWERHLAALRHLVAVSRQWIGGSFVSAKPEPGDIDVCSFVDGPTVDALSQQEQDLIRFMAAGKHTQAFWTVDSYVVTEYPVGSPHRSKYEDALRYWSSWWGQSRPDDHGNVQPRGFLDVQ